MSSIHKTKSGTYELSWRENGKQKSKCFPTKKQAQTRQTEVDRRLIEGKPIVRRKDAPTVREFSNEWLASRTKLASTTQAKYADWLAVHIYPELGHLSLVDLKPSILAEWQKDRLAAGAGPAVLGKAQSLLGQILERAVSPHEYLDANPIRSLPRPEYEKKQHRWLTASEVELLRGWYLERDDLGSAALISVLAYVGIRPQDALARSWVDLGDELVVTSKVSDGLIVPGSKTGEGYKRRVKVPEPVREDLEEWRAHDGLIFPRASDGEPWTKNDWDNWRSRYPKKGKRPKCFKAAAEDTGLGETLKPYDLRHTAASLMAACGWSVVEIAHQLGHSPVQSQRDYQHLLSLDGPRTNIDQYIREARGEIPVFGIRSGERV